jgi:hypothetical protein
MTAATNRDIHRIGGASIENLKLKPKEAALPIPGISVLKCPSPGDAAQQIRSAFPVATDLHDAAKTMGSTTEELIRNAGFDIISAPTKKLPNHFRIIHPSGIAGFTDANLALLARAFVETTGH